jgi:hypothetical protein
MFLALLLSPALAGPAGFARDARDAVRSLRGVECTIDEAQFALRCADDSVYNLGNAYAEWRAARRADRPAVLQQYFQPLPEVPSDWATASAHVRLRLRNTLYRLVTAEASTERAAELGIVCRPVAEHLCAQLVYDTPTAMASVSGDRLAEWGVTEDEAYATGLANLAAAAPSAFVRTAPGVWTSAVGDSYDSSRLLLPRATELAVMGAPVALPATRDLLLVTGRDDDEGIARILQAAAESLEAQRLETVRPVIWRDGAWSPLDLPPDHPSHHILGMLTTFDLAREYAKQKELLDARNTREGRDVFVAAYVVYETDDGGMSSVSSWAPIETCNPYSADYAVISPDGTEMAVVPQARVLALEGTWIRTDPDAAPRRWCSLGVLTAEAYDALTAGLDRRPLSKR